MSILVTVKDLQNGDEAIREISDDYLVITAGNHYLDGVIRHANGTVQLTVKVAKE